MKNKIPHFFAEFCYHAPNGEQIMPKNAHAVDQFGSRMIDDQPKSTRPEAAGGRRQRANKIRRLVTEF